MGISLHDLIMLGLNVIQRSLVTDVWINNTHMEWSLWGVGVMLQAVGGSRCTCSRAKSVSKNMNFFSYLSPPFLLHLVPPLTCTNVRCKLFLVHDSCRQCQLYESCMNNSVCLASRKHQTDLCCLNITNQLT